MTKKGKQGQKLDKGESLYSPELAAKAKQIILEAQLIKSDGSLHYTKIASILDVPVRTFSHWRNPESEYYKPQLSGALEEARKELTESIDLRKIHAGVIRRAQGRAKEVTKIKEPVSKGPELPAFSRYTKTDLVTYARQVLKLTLKPRSTKGAMEMAIRRRVKKLTTEKMQTVREVEKTLPIDVAAAKYANQNLGPADKRWSDKQDVNISGEVVLQPPVVK